MWLSNSSVGRKVVMSVTGIALRTLCRYGKAQDCGMGFSEHARTGYHRNRGFGPAPGKLLG